MAAEASVHLNRNPWRDRPATKPMRAAGPNLKTMVTALALEAHLLCLYIAYLDSRSEVRGRYGLVRASDNCIAGGM
jgi:hypothetical protein